MRCCVALAERMFRSAHGARFDDRLQFHSGVSQNTVGHFELTAHLISCGHPRASQAHRKYQIEGRPLHVWTFSLPTSRRTRDAHDLFLLCVHSTRLSVDEAAVFFEEFRSVSGVNPSLLLMTRFAHCNRIFALSPHCSGVVSHALLCVLIATSPVQFAQAVLVGLALRCQDANATRNIPQVVRKKEAVIVSIWKRALVNKLNTMALIVETLHVANAFIFISVLPIHVFRSFR